MPLLVDKPIGKNSRLVLWNITESTETLFDLLGNNGESEAASGQSELFKVNERLKKQRISVRLLLKQLSEELPSCLAHDENNKPYLRQRTEGISISHSGDLAAVIMNRKGNTGLDIELIGDKIERIAGKFLNESELKAIDSQSRTQQLTICWCAKEALYKFYGKKELDFREHLLLDPCPLGDTGNIRGRIRTPGLNTDLTLGFEKIGKYMLVYVNDMA